jgi:hypothetical protein
MAVIWIDSERFKPAEPWTPANTTTTLWLDAADASTTSVTSGKLLSWTDKSSSANKSATAISTGPNYLTNGLNSLPVIEFTAAAAQAMSLASAVDSFNATIAIVARHDSNTLGQIFSHSTLNRQIRFQSTGGEVHLGGAFSGGNPFSMTSAGQTTGVYYIITINAPSLGGQIFINGTNVTASGNAPGSSFLFDQIGRRSTSNEPLHGKIAETFWMPTSNNTTLRQQAEGYLGHRWGLAPDLPADHPYKAAAPTQ